MERFCLVDHSVINQHIDFTDILSDFVKCCLDCLFIAEIQLISVRLTTFFVDIAQRLCQSIWVNFDERNDYAISRCPQRHLTTYAPPGTSNDNFLTCDITHQILLRQERLQRNNKINFYQDICQVRSNSGSHWERRLKELLIDLVICSKVAIDML